jgi:hypothetical protein
MRTTTFSAAVKHHICSINGNPRFFLESDQPSHKKEEYDIEGKKYIILGVGFGCKSKD